MASYVYFKGKLGFHLMKAGSARVVFGDHPRAQALQALELGERPLFAGFFPETQGVLDDHFECWFLSADAPPVAPPQGLESIVSLGQSQQWLAPPVRTPGTRT
jgi:hypothetical protein